MYDRQPEGVMGIEERIAAVLRAHRFIPSDLVDGCQGCMWEGVLRDSHDRHVAAVLVAELGLTEETALRVDWPHQSVVLTDRVDIRAAHRFLDCDLVDVSRHVTPWTPA